MTKQGAVGPTNIAQRGRKKMTLTKDNWIEERCDAMDKGMKAGNCKEAHGTQNELTKTNQQRSAVLDIKIVS